MILHKLPITEKIFIVLVNILLHTNENNLDPDPKWQKGKFTDEGSELQFKIEY